MNLCWAPKSRNISNFKMLQSFFSTIRYQDCVGVCWKQPYIHLNTKNDLATEFWACIHVKRYQWLYVLCIVTNLSPAFLTSHFRWEIGACLFNNLNTIITHILTHLQIYLNWDEQQFYTSMYYPTPRLLLLPPLKIHLVKKHVNWQLWISMKIYKFWFTLQFKS